MTFFQKNNQILLMKEKEWYKLYFTIAFENKDQLKSALQLRNVKSPKLYNAFSYRI